jgi:filamentous hemagglutinin
MTRLFTVLLLSTFCAAVHAQITIPTSISTSAFPAINSCSNCTITLDPGVVLTINSNVSCSNCTFTGGTIKFNSGTITLASTGTFNSDTVIINTPLNIQSMNFNGDSVAVNSGLSYTTGGTTISNSAISVAAAVSFTNVGMTNDRLHVSAAMTSNATTLNNTTMTLSGSGNFTATATTFTGSTITMNGTNTSFKSNSSLTISGTHINMNNTSSLTSSGAMSISGGAVTSAGKIFSGGGMTLAGDTIIQTGGYIAGSSITTKANGAVNTTISLSGAARDSTNGNFTIANTSIVMSDSSAIKGSSVTYSTGSLTMNDKALLAPSNGLTFTSATVSMNDTAMITAGSLTIQTGSYVTIGDGQSTSKANITIANALKVLDTSTLAIAGHNNFFTSGSNSFTGGTHSFSIATNTISCGGAGENACKPDFVFGCATMNGSGALACVVLAVADIDLSAAPAGDNTVTLGWSDVQSASADHYLIERSSAGRDWTTLATIDANGYAAGTYHFEDAAAPAGTDNYRIARVDQYGATIYSAISSVTLATTATGIRIFPNPATGHLLNISVPNTGQSLVNMYTLTGQLIGRSVLQGQTQYQIQLPAQMMSGTSIIIQVVRPDQTLSFPVLLR